jgi:hypothetical protein
MTVVLGREKRLACIVHRRSLPPISVYMHLPKNTPKLTEVGKNRVSEPCGEPRRGRSCSHSSALLLLQQVVHIGLSKWFVGLTQRFCGSVPASDMLPTLQVRVAAVPMMVDALLLHDRLEVYLASKPILPHGSRWRV